MRDDEERVGHVAEAKRAAEECLSHLRALGKGNPCSDLVDENRVLRERIATMEREVAGDNTGLGNDARRLNNNAMAVNLKEAAYSFAVDILGEDAVQNVDRDLLVRWSHAVVEKMSFRQMLCVILYYGLDGRGRSRTLNQVSRMLGVSVSVVQRGRDRPIMSLRFRSDEILSKLAAGVLEVRNG